MTQKAALLLPMVILIFFTFGIMMWMLKLRYKAVMEDGLNVQYFKLYNKAEIPDYLRQITQHFNNLLEIPIFYYLALILLILLDTVDSMYVLLSWGFLLSRLAHSYIHTTSNKIKYRKNTFIFSMLILMILWLRITVDIINV